MRRASGEQHGRPGRGFAIACGSQLRVRRYAGPVPPDQASQDAIENVLTLVRRQISEQEEVTR